MVNVDDLPVRAVSFASVDRLPLGSILGVGSIQSVMTGDLGAMAAIGCGAKDFAAGAGFLKRLHTLFVSLSDLIAITILLHNVVAFVNSSGIIFHNGQAGLY